MNQTQQKYNSSKLPMLLDARLTRLAALYGSEKKVALEKSSANDNGGGFKG